MIMEEFRSKDVASLQAYLRVRNVTNAHQLAFQTNVLIT